MGKKIRAKTAILPECSNSRLIQEWCWVTPPARQLPFRCLTPKLFSKHTGYMLWFLLGHEKWQHQKFIVWLQNECACEGNSGLLFDDSGVTPPLQAPVSRSKARLTLMSLELDNKQIDNKNTRSQWYKAIFVPGLWLVLPPELRLLLHYLL